MPQVITPPLAGLDLGFASGNLRVKILVGTGDPNVVATDSTGGDIAGAALASLYLRLDGPDSTHFLYVKTGLATGNNPAGMWTPK